MKGEVDIYNLRLRLLHLVADLVQSLFFLQPGA
jgi:hypothetical protein